MLAIDHVQLAMPAGQEARARAFYADVLGMREVAKPTPLAASGGVWFVLGEVQLHLGVEPDYRPSRKAHPAIRVADLVALSSLCAAAGFPPEFGTRYPPNRWALETRLRGRSWEIIVEPDPDAHRVVIITAYPSVE